MGVKTPLQVKQPAVPVGKQPAAPMVGAKLPAMMGKAPATAGGGGRLAAERAALGDVGLKSQVRRFANGGRNWIAGATPPGRKGIFKAKAQAAGESTAAYAAQEAHAPGKLGAQAREAQTLMKLGKRK